MHALLRSLRGLGVEGYCDLACSGSVSRHFCVPNHPKALFRHDIAEPNVGEDLMLRPGVQYVHPSYEIVKEGTEKMDVDTL